MKKELCDVFQELNDGMCNGDWEHHEIIEQFAGFIEDSLELKVEFGFSEEDVQKLLKAVEAIENLSKIRVNFEKLTATPGDGHFDWLA